MQSLRATNTNPLTGQDVTWGRYLDLWTQRRLQVQPKYLEKYFQQSLPTSSTYPLHKPSSTSAWRYPPPSSSKKAFQWPAGPAVLTPMVSVLRDFLKHIKTSVPLTLDPSQFAHRENRSTVYSLVLKTIIPVILIRRAVWPWPLLSRSAAASWTSPKQAPNSQDQPPSPQAMYRAVCSHYTGWMHRENLTQLKKKKNLEWTSGSPVLTLFFVLQWRPGEETSHIQFSGNPYLWHTAWTNNTMVVVKKAWQPSLPEASQKKRHHPHRLDVVCGVLGFPQQIQKWYKDW